MYTTEIPSYLDDTGVSQYRHYSVTGSTNNDALAWAEADAPDFSLVMADEQTSGRGRFERRWISKPGGSLAFSLILRPSPAEIHRLPRLSPLAGIAVSEAVNTLLGVRTQIKWPNDVLLNRRKFCGILVEAQWTGATLAVAVMGIGINVLEQAVPSSSDQSFEATSLQTETGIVLDRGLLLREVLHNIRLWRDRVGTHAFMQRWQRDLAFLNEMVRLEHSEKPSIIGRVKGIDPQGKLILVDESGGEQKFEIGDVHLRAGEHSIDGGEHAG